MLSAASFRTNLTDASKLFWLFECVSGIIFWSFIIFWIQWRWINTAVPWRTCDTNRILQIRIFFLHLLHQPGCHESCSECHGLSQQECISCSDPAALLKDGECVTDCGAGYYSQEGVCYGKVDMCLHWIMKPTISHFSFWFILVLITLRASLLQCQFYLPACSRPNKDVNLFKLSKQTTKREFNPKLWESLFSSAFIIWYCHSYFWPFYPAIVLANFHWIMHW